MKKLIIITLLFSTSCLMAEPAPGRAALLKNKDFGCDKIVFIKRVTYTAIFSYIEAFYNTSRIHTSLPGGNTPIGTEEFFFLEKEKTVTITPQEERALVTH